MSLRATTWALYEAPKDIDAITFRLLMIIADNCDDNGCGFAYSTQKLADLAGVNKRTVQNRLPAMVDAGIIRLGNQDIVAYLPANKRPKVYDLVMAPAQRSAGNTLPMSTAEPADNDEEASTEGSNTCSTRGEYVSPQTSKNFESRGERGVHVGCTWGERIRSPKTIETIETIEREPARKKTSRTKVRTSLTDSGYDPHLDPLAAAIAAGTHLDIDAAFAAFTDYYTAEDARFIDWGAKFRLWLRREKNYTTAAPAFAAAATHSTGSSRTASTQLETPRPPRFCNQIDKSANASYYHATGKFADLTRNVLTEKFPQLPETQKLGLFPRALHVAISTQDKTQVEQFIQKETSRG